MGGRKGEKEEEGEEEEEDKSVCEIFLKGGGGKEERQLGEKENGVMGYRAHAQQNVLASFSSSTLHISRHSTYILGYKNEIKFGKVSRSIRFS